jgi:hypothetical protein
MITDRELQWVGALAGFVWAEDWRLKRALIVQNLSGDIRTRAKTVPIYCR